MQHRPYPYERLLKLSRREIESYARLRSLYDGRALPDALRVAGALLGSELSVSQGGAPELAERARVIERLGALGPSSLLLLEAGSQALDACVLIELSAAFAERLVDRALGGEAAALPPSLLPLDEMARGVLSYLVARVLGALRGSLRLRHVASDPAEIAPGLGNGPYLVCAFGLRAGPDEGGVRVFAPLGLCSSLPQRSVRNDLGMLPLTLIARAGRGAIRATELAKLRLGDVIVLDQSSLVFDGQRFEGRVLVHVAGSGTQLFCRARERGLEIESLALVKEPKMTNGRLSQSPEPRANGPDIAADAPLELSVELARFSMTLAELQRSAPGDVLLTGRTIGEAVTVRVGGSAFAEGELVDVEGEVGVRIRRFLGQTSG
jgi:type III secretion protein Q